MYQTRGELKRRIAALERERDELYNAQKLQENSGRAKCKGIMCKSCEHAVFILGDYGIKQLVGCDLTVSCPDYKKKTTTELM